MKCEKIQLKTQEAYLETYFLDAHPELKNSQNRPLVLICPGGGYGMVSAREAEPVAMAFAARGFHSAVLIYPVAPARFPQALYALGEAMAWLRVHAAENHIDPRKIAVNGYSAGGHLAASLGVFWKEPFLAEAIGCPPEELRPDAMILGYPVITSGAFAHRKSIGQLLGETPDKALLEKVSLEKRVTADVPPSFLWHTYTDELVPVENSLLFANALQKAGVPMELHIYSTGAHGLSLANKVTEGAKTARLCPDCEGWVELACAWLRRQTGYLL